MNWVDSALRQLSDQPACGYTAEQEPATESTALCAMALASAGRVDAALRACEWLAEAQTNEGSVPVRLGADGPRWATGLAVLAWIAVDPEGRRFQSHVDKAVNWSLSFSGQRNDPNSMVGHDTTLAAWPWVEGTHSWIEPSAFSVLALKAAGREGHPRVREAAKLLFDRQLPTGGWNYGNTVVLGQMLRPHVQPTGLSLLALAGEEESHGRVEHTLPYLEAALASTTACSSLGWGLMGLTACRHRPEKTDEWLRHAAEQTGRRRPFGHRLALLLLANDGERCPLIRLTSRRHVTAG